MSINTRAAEIEDVKMISGFDEFAGSRRFEMFRGELLIADSGDKRAVGYMKITSNEFFNRPLIAIVNTHPDFRGRGIATALIKRAVEQAAWHEIYTTTEASNTPMQRLLPSLGFEHVGEIQGFNYDGEAELIYRFNKAT